MRKIARRPLSKSSREVLDELQAAVDNSSTPAVDVQVLWSRRRSGKNRRAAFEHVRATLGQMASGRERCMYCEDSAGTDIEHFYPKSMYPSRCFRWHNYLLACSHCNSNEKRTQFPLDSDSAPLLLDPTKDDPYEHIAFVPETGQFQGVTPQGERTVAEFGLNRRQILERGRRTTWITLTALFKECESAIRAKDDDWKKKVVQAVRALSFQSVVQHYIRDGLDGRETVPLRVGRFLRRTKREWEWAL
jgi:uncharacterized protein (TIGR02646 family)